MILKYLNKVLRKVFLKIKSKIFIINYTLKYKSFERVDKYIWIDISNIYGWYQDKKLRKFTFPGVIMGGDWSEYVKIDSIENRLKYRGLLQRYNEKKDWLETELFQERYIPKIEKGLKVRGLSNINSLLELYTGYYDTLYQDIKKYGVRTKFENGECIDPLYIHIYKDGEILFTSDGNHRLFIYHLLGYKKIPVRVWMRHKQWQEKKETLFNSLQSENIITDKKLLDHPDLKEILKVFQSKVK